MPVIEILVGPPASGKSSYARERQKQSALRLNKDLIRRMALGVQFDADREEVIHGIYCASIKPCMKSGQDVILDATNLGKKDIENMQSLIEKAQSFIEYQYEVVVKDDFCKINESELLRRDSERPDGEQVGPEVIKMMMARVDYYLKRKNQKDIND